MVASPHSVQQVAKDFVFALPVVFDQGDHSEQLPQVSQGECQCVLLVSGLFEDISCLHGLQLVEVAKCKHREAPKHGVHHGDFSQSEVQVVQHVCRDHADLVNYDAPQISEQKPLFFPLLLGHGEEGAAELEAEQGVEGLPIDVSRCCASEGGEDDIWATGVVTSFLEGLCHHGVDGVDQPGLASACASVDKYQGWRGPGELLVRGGQWEGDAPLGIVENHGEHLLLPCVQVPCLFDLKVKTLNIFMHIFGSVT